MTRAVLAKTCGAMTEVGSYPGDWLAMCSLKLGHDGQHEDTYSWDDDPPYTPEGTQGGNE